MVVVVVVVLVEMLLGGDCAAQPRHRIKRTSKPHPCIGETMREHLTDLQTALRATDKLLTPLSLVLVSAGNCLQLSVSVYFYFTQLTSNGQPSGYLRVRFPYISGP